MFNLFNVYVLPSQLHNSARILLQTDFKLQKQSFTDVIQFTEHLRWLLLKLPCTNISQNLCVIRHRKSKVYINDELRIYLRLPVLCKERIFIKTFGKVEPTIKPAIIQLKALSPSKSVMIEAICTPFTCSDTLNELQNRILSILSALLLFCSIRIQISLLLVFRLSVFYEKKKKMGTGIIL